MRRGPDGWVRLRTDAPAGALCQRAAAAQRPRPHAPVGLAPQGCQGRGSRPGALPAYGLTPASTRAVCARSDSVGTLTVRGPGCGAIQTCRRAISLSGSFPAVSTTGQHTRAPHGCSLAPGCTGSVQLLVPVCIGLQSVVRPAVTRLRHCRAVYQGREHAHAASCEARTSIAPHTLLKGPALSADLGALAPLWGETAMALQNRMSKELKMLRKNPPEGVCVWPEGNSITRLSAQLQGPAGSVYEAGVFRLSVDVPDRCANPRARPSTNLLAEQAAAALHVGR